VEKLYDGSPLYPINQIQGFDEFAKRGYTYEVVVSGSQTELGYGQSKIESLVIRDTNNQDVTDQFDIQTANGYLHVYYSEIYAKSDTLTTTYDAKPLDLSGHVSFPKGLSLMPGHSIVVTSTAKTTVGDQINSYNITVKDANNNDVTSYYKISRSFGTLHIQPRSITMQAGSAEKPYDGTALTSQAYELIAGTLAEGHRIKKCTVIGAQTEIGRSENRIVAIEIIDQEGKSVTANYAIELLPGQLKVTVK
jgi:hypothetical protein